MADGGVKDIDQRRETSPPCSERGVEGFERDVNEPCDALGSTRTDARADAQVAGVRWGVG